MCVSTVCFGRRWSISHLSQSLCTKYLIKVGGMGRSSIDGHCMLCLMPGRWRGAPTPPAPGAPLWHTPHDNSSLFSAYSTQASSSLQMVTGQLVMLWCFGVGYGQKEGLPHPQQTSTSRASGIRSGFGLLGTTLCFQPCWGWKHCGRRGTESAWNPRTRRITCLVERFFAFIPVPCCPLMHLT